MAGVSWTPSHSPDPLKQRHESWKPGEPKGTKVAPAFGEVYAEAKVELWGMTSSVPREEGGPSCASSICVIR